MANSALQVPGYDNTPPGPKKEEEVPAEVSKRGVMIGNFEGALSSRRKRAGIIIQNGSLKIKEKIRPRGAFPK
jgi:hypothetical protein